MERAVWLMASASGFLAVALGAFGAHGLQKYLQNAENAAQRLAWWHTAAQYQMYHALALGLLAVLCARQEAQLARSAWLAASGFGLGTLLFCGSLYVMTLSGVRALGAITPLGGVGFLLGWAALGHLAWSALRAGAT